MQRIKIDNTFMAAFGLGFCTALVVIGAVGLLVLMASPSPTCEQQALEQVFAPVNAMGGH